MDLYDYSKFYGKSVFETQEHSKEELDAILDLATIFQDFEEKGVKSNYLEDRLAFALFFDNSTRTKSSFAGAAARLGAKVVIEGGETTQVSHGETAVETGAMLGMNADVLGIRHDKILGQGNTFIRDCAQGANEYLKAMGSRRRMPAINLQCDIDHPTQSFADVMKLRESYGNLKGKKIVMSWAYSPSYAKPLSVAQGFITLATKYGADIVLAHPEGYELLPKTLENARKNAEASEGSFTTTNNMQEAFKDAHVVYPKSWGPYDLMLQRVEANKNKDTAKLEDLEKQMLALNAQHKDWICDEAKMSLTNNAQYMHCLPADLGDEVTMPVYNAAKDFMYNEANKKLYAIMALMAAGAVPDLNQKLEKTMSV